MNRWQRIAVASTAVVTVAAGAACEPRELNRWGAWFRGAPVLDGVGNDPLGPPQYYKGVVNTPTVSHLACVQAAQRRGVPELQAGVACDLGEFFIEWAQGGFDEHGVYHP